jgi:hypothetical protein
MLHKKGKRDSDNWTRARVKKEMAKPRMAKSARIAQRNLKKGAHVQVAVTPRRQTPQLTKTASGSA